MSNMSQDVFNIVYEEAGKTKTKRLTTEWGAKNFCGNKFQGNNRDRLIFYIREDEIFRIIDGKMIITNKKFNSRDNLINGIAYLRMCNNLMTESEYEEVKLINKNINDKY